MEVTTNSAEETKELAFKLAKNIKGGDIICLYGQLGSGKTTFVQGLVNGLGIKDKVQSPTFVVMRFYGKKLQVAHIDLYRLESKEEVENLGLEEYFGNKDTVCVIEWPELLEDVLPSKTIRIRFDYLSKSKRKIKVI